MLGSGILGFLAGLTRPEGLFAFIAILFKRVNLKAQSKAKVAAIASCMIVFSSLLVILLLAWGIKGNPMLIFSVEHTWDKVTLVTAFNHPAWILDRGFIEFYLFSIPAIIISIFVISRFFVSNRKNIFGNKLFPYFAYSGSLLLFYLYFGDIRSLTRFIWVLIPVYWGLAVLTRDRKRLKIVLLLFFIIQLVIGSILFANWYHFQ